MKDKSNRQLIQAMRDTDYSLAGILGSSIPEQAIQTAQSDGEASDLEVCPRKM